jgi:3-oxoadipate enol-lactonase
MPVCRSGDADIRYRLDGPAAAPVLVLSNSLGTDLAMWDAVVPAWSDGLRLLRMDTRGHGASSVTPGDYTLGLLAGDVLAAMDAAGVAQAHFCGLSMGGMIGQHLALHAPERFGRFVLANTSAQMPREPWDQRAAAVRAHGMAAIADIVIQRFFSAPFIAARSPALTRTRETLLALDPQGYAACCCAIRDMELFDAIPAIRKPVLVMVGRDDVATPGPMHGARIAAAIPGAQFLEVPGGHLSPVEAPEPFARAVMGFLSG